MIQASQARDRGGWGFLSRRLAFEGGANVFCGRQQRGINDARCRPVAAVAGIDALDGAAERNRKPA